MMLRYHHLTRSHTVFRALTGLAVAQFDALVAAVLPRASGGGRKFELPRRDHLLLAVVRRRRYPTYPVLGFLFGVSAPPARRAVARVLPLLEAAGRDTMRRPDPGQGHRRTRDELPREPPELAAIIDAFEQRVQRPKDRRAADTYYSGKKERPTRKRQRAVAARDGRIVDSTLLKDSGLLSRLPAGVGGLGDPA